MVDEIVNCSHCGRSVHKDDAMWGWDDDSPNWLRYTDRLCPSCVEKMEFCPDCNDSDFPHVHCIECGNVLYTIPHGSIRGTDSSAPEELGEDEVICPACVDDRYYYCYECEQYIHRDNSHTHCSLCGDVIQEGYDYYFAEWSDPVCGDCFNNRGISCPDCGDILFEDDFDDHTHRHERTPEMDGLHWENPPMEFFHGENWDGLFRYIGLEIEFEVTDVEEDRFARRNLVRWFDNQGHDLFWLKKDMSLSKSGGVELCSHPITYKGWRDYGWKELDKLLTVFKEDFGCKAWNQQRSCAGIHISLSRNWWDGRSHEARTWDFIASNQGFIRDISRRRTWRDLEEWANPNPATDKWEMLHRQVFCRDMRDRHDRYVSLNLENCSRNEWRIFRSTLDINAIKGYVDIVLAIVEFTRTSTHRTNSAQDFRIWLWEQSRSRFRYAKKLYKYIL